MGGEEEISSSKEKRKRERRGRRRKEERKERKETSGFFLRSATFRQSKFVGLRSKVCLRNEGYALRGRDSFYFGLFSTLRAVWFYFCLKRLTS